MISLSIRPNLHVCLSFHEFHQCRCILISSSTPQCHQTPLLTLVAPYTSAAHHSVPSPEFPSSPPPPPPSQPQELHHPSPTQTSYAQRLPTHLQSPPNGSSGSKTHSHHSPTHRPGTARVCTTAQTLVRDSLLSIKDRGQRSWVRRLRVGMWIRCVSLWSVDHMCVCRVLLCIIL